jgi:glycosyltransferase involved in cell wall biosynthesis
MNRAVRTLLFSTLYPSSTRPLHGIFVETRLREFLKLGGAESRVVAPVPWFPSSHARWGEYARIAATPRKETRHGIEVHHPRYFLPPRVGMSVAPVALALAALPAVRALRRTGFDFDLIDAHYYYPDGVAAVLLARWLDRPVTITARGTDLNLIPSFALPRRMIRWAARHAEASIGVCKALTDVLRQFDVDGRRLHVMRNGIDLERFAPLPPDEARARVGIGGGPVILSVGQLIERKGHHLLVEAMPAVLAKHPSARLVIVGEGPDREKLQAAVRGLGVGDRVTLAGSVPNQQMAMWYSAADLLVLASSREGWANVLLESMACGTPVVATRIWGTPEVVSERAVGLLVDRREAPALADAVLEALWEPRDRAEVRRYAERFGWHETSVAQLELFRRLVDPADRGRLPR